MSPFLVILLRMEKAHCITSSVRREIQSRRYSFGTTSIQPRDYMSRRTFKVSIRKKIDEFAQNNKSSQRKQREEKEWVNSEA